MLTSFTSILEASASKAFSINSLTTLETEVMVCVLVTSFTVDDGSCLIDIFHSSKTDITVFYIHNNMLPTENIPLPSLLSRLTLRATCDVCTNCQPFTSKTQMLTPVTKNDNSGLRNRGILAFQSVYWCST